MKLYLVQHGEAEEKEISPDRPLTEKGGKDSSKTAEFLKSAGITLDVIWHSTKTRARETASIFREALSPGEGTMEKEGLSPNDPAENVFNEITLGKKDIMIVGHLPFLEKLASRALFGSEEYKAIKFNMGGVLCLEENKEGKWQLAFEVIPALLR